MELSAIITKDKDVRKMLVTIEKKKRKTHSVTPRLIVHPYDERSIIMGCLIGCLKEEEFQQPFMMMMMLMAMKMIA